MYFIMYMQWLCFTYSGTYAGGLGVPSWEERLAVVMQGHNVQTGTSGDMCYVRVGVENRVLQRGESFIHDADPCLRYICEVMTEILKSSFLCGDIIA